MLPYSSVPSLSLLPIQLWSRPTVPLSHNPCTISPRTWMAALFLNLHPLFSFCTFTLRASSYNNQTHVHAYLRLLLTNHGIIPRVFSTEKAEMKVKSARRQLTGQTHGPPGLLTSLPEAQASRPPGSPGLPALLQDAPASRPSGFSQLSCGKHQPPGLLASWLSGGIHRLSWPPGLPAFGLLPAFLRDSPASQPSGFSWLSCGKHRPPGLPAGGRIPRSCSHGQLALTPEVTCDFSCLIALIGTPNQFCPSDYYMIPPDFLFCL